MSSFHSFSTDEVRDSRVARIIIPAVLDAELMRGLFATEVTLSAAFSVLHGNTECIKAECRHIGAGRSPASRPGGNTNSNTNKGSNPSH